MKPLWISMPLAAFLVLTALPAGAQPVISAKSGVIAYGEGTVYVGQNRWESSAAKFETVAENSVVRTAAGRVEVLLVPGSFLRLGENGSFRLITNRLIDTRLELLGGSAVLELDSVNQDNHVTLVYKDATLSFPKAGLYHLDAEPGRLRVFRGEASVQTGGQTVRVTGGKMLTLDGQTASVEKFDSDDTDALDRWSRRRGELVAESNVWVAKSWHDGARSLQSDMWAFNPYLGAYTLLPMDGRIYSPYGGFFWSPLAVIQLYQAPVQVWSPGYGGFPASSPGYRTSAPTASGYSGAVASAPVMTAAPAASTGSTAASSAASSTIGHGSVSGGGRGH